MYVHDEESKVVVLCDDCAGGLAGVDELTIGGHSSPDCMHCGYIFAGFLEQAHHYRRSDLVKLTARLVLIVKSGPADNFARGQLMAMVSTKAKNMQLVAMMTAAVEGADEKAITVAALTLAMVHARATEMTLDQFVWLTRETWPPSSQGGSS